MFERFTENARHSVVFAQEEARKLGHRKIGTDHLLLGLLSVEDGLAATVLGELGVRLTDVRANAERGDGGDATGQIPFTPHAKRVLELSLREALSIGDNHIGTEHILLGLARENDGPSAAFLPDPDSVRDAVIAKLGAARAIRKTRAGSARRAWFGRRAEMPRWEYRVEEREVIDAGWLNELGAEGWMLAGVSGAKLIFQRPCDPPGEFVESA